MNLLFRLFLTFNASSLIIVVYLVNNGIVLNDLESLPNWVSYALYFGITVLFSLISLLASNLLDNDNIESENGSQISDIQQANDSFLPSYLGYFFVSLGINNSETLFFVYAVIFLFTFLSQTQYFNPLLLILGYHFFYLTTKNNVQIFMITKKKLKNPAEINFKSLKRVNDFTFIDNEK